MSSGIALLTIAVFISAICLVVTYELLKLRAKRKKKQGE